MIKRILSVLLVITALATVTCVNSGGTFKPFALAHAEKTDTSADEAALQLKYDEALELLNNKQYKEALDAFEALGTYSDSKRKAQAARYRYAEALFMDGQFEQAKELFEALGSFRESRTYLYECKIGILSNGFEHAEELMEAGDYEGAVAAFEALGSFHGSPERAKEAQELLEAEQYLQAEKAAYEQGVTLLHTGDYAAARDSFIQAGDYQGATEQVYAAIDLLLKRTAYEQADAAFENGEYETACIAFEVLDGFEDSKDRAQRCAQAQQALVYEQVKALNEQGRAYVLCLWLNGYEDSADIAADCKQTLTDQHIYAAAAQLEQEGEYAQAKVGFEAVMTYRDSAERADALETAISQAADFERASLLRMVGRYEEANALYEALGDYQNAAELVEDVPPTFTAKQLRDDQTSPKSDVFTAPDGTKHRYQIYKGVHTWLEAKAFCNVLGGHLATLTTAEENDFVFHFMRDSGYTTAYFGLWDEYRNGNWQWVTGEPFEYSFWNPGEPSRSGRERYGMYFYKHTDGSWNDSHFYEDAEEDPGCSFICEWDE